MIFELAGSLRSKSVINQYWLDTKQPPALEYIKDYKFVQNQKIVI
jgi:hypothetical protein